MGPDWYQFEGEQMLMGEDVLPKLPGFDSDFFLDVRAIPSQALTSCEGEVRAGQ